MDSLQPPVPPAIAAQQGAPPLQQFAQGAAGQAQQLPPSEQLMSQLLTQIGDSLSKLAQITVQVKPELVPILKQAIQALAMFEGKIKTSPVGQGGMQGGAPAGGDQGTAGAGAPDAGGGAAMGMPQ